MAFVTQAMAGDAGPIWPQSWGVIGVPVTSADMSALTDVTAAPAAGDVVCIDDIFISSDTALSFKLEEETSNTVVFGPWYVGASGSIQITPRGKLRTFVAAKKLRCIFSGAGNVVVLIGWHPEGL